MRCSWLTFIKLYYAPDFYIYYSHFNPHLHDGDFPGGANVKNPPANAGDMRDTGSISGSERSCGGGHGNPLHYSFLENPTDRGAWWAIVHKVAESWTLLKQPSTCALHDRWFHDHLIKKEIET